VEQALQKKAAMNWIVRLLARISLAIEDQKELLRAKRAAEAMWRNSQPKK